MKAQVKTIQFQRQKPSIKSKLDRPIQEHKHIIYFKSKASLISLFLSLSFFFSCTQIDLILFYLFNSFSIHCILFVIVVATTYNL